MSKGFDERVKETGKGQDFRQPTKARMYEGIYVRLTNITTEPREAQEQIERQGQERVYGHMDSDS